MADKAICSRADCGKPAFRRGLCYNHYREVKHTSVCSVPDCGRRARPSGLCDPHYRRELAYGEPTAGRRLRGDAERWIREYLIAGEHGDECITWPFSRLGNGYGFIFRNRSQMVASRFVCEQAHGPAPEPWYEAAHECGRGHQGCVSPRHLRWKTPVENRFDKIAHGTHLGGADHPSAKLSREQAEEVRRLASLMPHSWIAKQMGVSRSVISRVVKHQSYI